MSRVGHVYINTSSAIEKLADNLARDHPLPFECHYVGPLHIHKEVVANTIEEQNDPAIAFLDAQKPASTIFITFGTVVPLQPPAITAIANALIRSGRPFVWSLRSQFFQYLPSELQPCIRSKNDTADTTKEPKQHPNGIILEWVPQRAILAHPATGVSLSHCGCNTFIETVGAGIPLLAWPLFADHFFNARMVTASGAGIVIPGTFIGPEGRIPSTEEIEESLKKLLDVKGYQESANEFRKNGKKAALDQNEVAHRNICEIAKLATKSK